MRYKIGDLVLVKSQSASGPMVGRQVFEIDGVTEKMVGGSKEIRYESGDQKFLETAIEGKVILEKPRAPRTRRSKKNGIGMDQQLDFKTEPEKEMP